MFDPGWSAAFHLLPALSKKSTFSVWDNLLRQRILLPKAAVDLAEQILRADPPILHL